MKIVFWWNIPCAGMIGVLKSYCEVIDNSAVVVTGTLSTSRKSMGWADKGKLFSSHIVLSDDEWDSRSREILNRYSDRLHVFNGITHPPRIMRVINHAITEGIKFCNMSEAYSNLSFGLKGVIKSMYIRYYLPHTVRHIAMHSSGVLCLSGGDLDKLKQFERLGFPRNLIFPFGYYTDEDTSYHYQPALDGKIHLLCPGLLEKYKGVDILIKALHIVANQGIQNYVCHITGKGQQESYLKSLVAKYNLESYVIFEGVLDVNKYDELLSHIDILVAPGRVEPWGIRINEAIQRGNVVIVSDGLGAAELVNTSKGGAVFKSGNINSLAKIIKQFLISKNKIATAKQNNLNYKNNISCRTKAQCMHNILKKIMLK